MPSEKRFVGVARCSGAIPENATICGVAAAISFRSSPRIVPKSSTFSRPVSSGWNAAATLRSGSTRPRMRTTPEVGNVMPAIKRDRVDFPEPFAPMSAKHSAGAIVKVTSLTAGYPRGGSPRLRTRFAIAEIVRWRLASSPSSYAFVRCSAETAYPPFCSATANRSSDEVRKAHLHPREHPPAHDDQHCGHGEPDRDGGRVDGGSEQGPAPHLHDACEGIEGQYKRQSLGD